MYEIYFEPTPFKQALSHFKREAGKNLEALGLLLGEVRIHNGRKYVVVKEYVTAENHASSISVRFTQNAFKELSPKLSDKIIVGWIHSHPSYGCFLSSTDVRTQQAFFNEDYNFAFVIDPVQNDYRAFRVKNGRYYEVSFAVID
ncbi:Mov34/MPN/PAD-1 family protein [Candidatus Micrarchaeota archaeon]|nr:Mov34/MPN/PAD-1 family protein [Candidatus Micrarchaeota archaeon]